MNEIYDWLYNRYIAGEISADEYEQMLYDNGYYDYDEDGNWIWGNE